MNNDKPQISAGAFRGIRLMILPGVLFWTVLGLAVWCLVR